MDLIELNAELKQVASLIKQAESFQPAVYFTESDYQAYLDNSLPAVDVCGLEYPAGEALRLLDETAFNQQYANAVDAMDKHRFAEFEEIEEELEEIAEELEHDYPAVSAAILGSIEDL